jgi:hypothetical protein
MGLKYSHHKRLYKALSCALFDVRFRGRFMVLESAVKICNAVLQSTGIKATKKCLEKAFKGAKDENYVMIDHLKNQFDVPAGAIMAIRGIRTKKCKMLIVGCFDSIDAISSINDQRDVCRHFKETHELITVLERGRQFNIPAIIMREYTDYANEHFPQRKSLPPMPNAFSKRPRSSLSRPSSAASESNENKRGRPISPFEENGTEAEIERLQRFVDRMLKQHRLLDESTKRKQHVLAGQLKELNTLNTNIDSAIKRLKELNVVTQDSRPCISSNQQAVKMYYVLSDGQGEGLMLI